MKLIKISLMLGIILCINAYSQYVPSSMVAGIIKGTVTNYNRLPIWASTNNLYNQDMYWCKYGTNVYPAGLYRYTRTTTATNWMRFEAIAGYLWTTNSFVSFTRDIAQDTAMSNALRIYSATLDTTQSNIIWNNVFGSDFKTDKIIASLEDISDLNTGLAIYWDAHYIRSSVWEINSSSGPAINLFSKDTYNFFIKSTNKLYLKDKFLTSSIQLSETNETGLTGFTNTSIVGGLNELKLNVSDKATTNYVKSNDTSQSNIGRTFTLSRDTAQSNISIVNAKSYDTSQSNIVVTRYLNYASTNFVNSKVLTNKIYDIPAIAWDFPRGNFPAYFIATNNGDSPSEQISTIRFDDTSEEFILATLKLPSNIKTNAYVDFEVQGYSVTAPLAVSTNIRIKFSSSAAGKGNVWGAAYITNSSGNYEVDIIQGNIDEVKWSKRISYFGWTANQFVRIKLSRVLPAENNLVGDWALIHCRIKVRIE